MINAVTLCLSIQLQSLFEASVTTVTVLAAVFAAAILEALNYKLIGTYCSNSVCKIV